MLWEKSTLQRNIKQIHFSHSYPNSPASLRSKSVFLLCRELGIFMVVELLIKLD